jgi:hypothetical protein
VEVGLRRDRASLSGVFEGVTVALAARARKSRPKAARSNRGTELLLDGVRSLASSVLGGVSGLAGGILGGVGSLAGGVLHGVSSHRASG